MIIQGVSIGAFLNNAFFNSPRIPVTSQFIEMMNRFFFGDFSVECSAVEGFCYLLTIFELKAKLMSFHMKKPVHL